MTAFLFGFIVVTAIPTFIFFSGLLACIFNKLTVKRGDVKIIAPLDIRLGAGIICVIYLVIYYYILTLF